MTLLAVELQICTQREREYVILVDVIVKAEW